MDYEKLTRLITLISEKTGSDELKWEESAQEDTFQVAFPNYVVQITMTPETLDNYATYSLRILNDRNIVIEEVTPADLGRNFPDQKELLRELYTAARRQALGVEHALDTLLESLSGESGRGSR